MPSPKPIPDPYRVLGLLRGADPAQIKAAHRRLAKLYHPDGASGDEVRFLAVQEAYQLLADPRRRREWDRQHAPGPIRAAEARRSPSPTRPATSARPDRASPRGAARPGRDGGGRTRTWSAEHVPWWEDFRPGPRRPAPPSPGADPEPTVQDHGPGELDAFSRSSGAAWSAAARRHFRRGTDDLPSRGVWRYRGTQVVTGAEARKVADEAIDREGDPEA